MDCGARKKEREPCFEKSFASHEKAKCWSIKNKKTARQTFSQSNTKAWFDCDVCDHDFAATPNKVSSGRWCPYCSNPPKKLCECESCFKKTFASHPKAKCWSSKNKKTARQTFLQTNTKAWFNCDACEHDFESTVASVSSGQWCPYCAKPSRKLCDCDSCFKKTFASHPKAKCWSDKNKKSAKQTFLKTNTRVWFNCDACEHEFETVVSVVSNGYWCPYCANQKLCDCEPCYKKSFATHEKAKCWSDKNKKTARQTFLHSGTKAWFTCEKKHEFEMSVNDVSKGHWCSKCKNKTELLVLEFLCSHFENPEHQFKAKWCKNPETGRCLPFDICVSKTIIEVDGAQHYKQVMNWKTPEETQKFDRYKEECAIKNGYSVLRILQEDVWNNKIDWKALLLEHVKDYETPVVICLWKEENPSQ
ncbi:putative restriction endonuclease [Lausannevirus]|uniref:Putative restriction endonuclease n=1 Tax=Lausannevirus TaxID=999883 RepID=F2WL88_9VIRU|nr:endonuclease [Lausannevirus]AEA07011.1 putative restriction endonuclease [Lausannevirus]